MPHVTAPPLAVKPLHSLQIYSAKRTLLAWALLQLIPRFTAAVAPFMFAPKPLWQTAQSVAGVKTALE